jgi:hypothetical protein
LSRTKTSGLGKRVLTQEFSVANDAWFANPRWLTEGYWIWNGFLSDRDYLVPCPTTCREGVRDVLAVYRDLAALSQELFSHLRVPAFSVRSTGEDPPILDWCLLESALILPASGSFWTEHSERGGLISMASVLGFRADEVHYLGRWSPSSSQLYVRTSAAIITKIQISVATSVRKRLFGPDLFREGRLISLFGAHLTGAGWAEEVAECACDHLKLFRGQDLELLPPAPIPVEDSQRVSLPSRSINVRLARRRGSPLASCQMRSTSVLWASTAFPLSARTACIRVPCQPIAGTRTTSRSEARPVTARLILRRRLNTQQH